MTIAHWIGAAVISLGLINTAAAGPDHYRPAPHHDRAPHHQKHHPHGHYRPAPPPHYRPAPPPGPYYRPAPRLHPVVRVGYRVPPGHWGPPPSHYRHKLHHRHGHEWRVVGSDVVLISLATGIVAEVIYNAMR